MPRPPTDEELLASFTPLEWEFNAWYEENEREIANIAAEQGSGARADYINRKWSDPVQRKQYRAWVMKWFGRYEARMLYQMPPEEFIDMVKTTNFANSDSAAQFLFAMEMLNTPFVVLGKSDFGGVFTSYSLEPGPAYLWPHLEVTDDPMLMDRCVLGINTDVRIEYGTGGTGGILSSPRKRRRQERSSGEDSTHSTTSDDINLGGGFVFAQLGSLHTFAGDWRIAHVSKSNNDIIKGPWQATGFAIVVRLNEHGQPGAVYVIYNFYQDDDSDYANPKRIHVPVDDESGLPLPHIGRLKEGCSEVFTVAKIADSLSDLGMHKNFTFEVESHQECQIVRAKIWSVGQGRFILRQFVREARGEW